MSSSNPSAESPDAGADQRNTPQWPPNDPDVLAALQQCFADGSWGRYEGPNLERLTEALCQLQAAHFAIPCSSGTIAVELALRAVKVQPGDEVILAGYDFPGNFRAIEAIGAVPVLVDLARGRWCLDVDQVQKAVSPQTRAILVSHLHGSIANMSQLRQLADEHGIGIVEDACQVPGGTVEGKPTGSWGDAGVLSFGGSKLLTAGRGGAVVTNREDVFQRARIINDRGNLAFPLSELQAAVLLPQLNKLSERNKRRLDAAMFLRSEFKRLSIPLDEPDLNPPESVPAFYKLAWYFASERCGGHSREEFVAAVHVAGLPLNSGFRGFVRRSTRARRCGPLPESERAAELTVLLHHPILLDSTEQLRDLAARIATATQNL